VRMEGRRAKRKAGRLAQRKEQERIKERKERSPPSKRNSLNEVIQLFHWISLGDSLLGETNWNPLLVKFQ